jgi:hypothetical protein
VKGSVKFMKTFNVFYDIVIAPGVLEEKCLTVHNCNTKNDAIFAYDKLGLDNAIFRCVKAPLF